MPAGFPPGLPNPVRRIDGNAVLSNLKMDPCAQLAATVSDLGNRLTGLDPVAGLRKQNRIMSIKTEIAFAMIQDHQQTHTRCPLRQNHPTVIHGADHGAGIGFDKNAGPANPPGASLRLRARILQDVAVPPPQV